MRLQDIVLLFPFFVIHACGHTRSSDYFPDHLYIEPGVVAEFAIIAGLVICFCGFRLLRVMTFLSGFLVTGLLFSTALTNIFGLKTWVLAASWISFVILGLAGGCVALAFFSFGVTLVGMLLAYVLTLSLPYRMLPIVSSTVLDGAVVLMGGTLAWLLVRPLAIVASSLVGAIVTVWGVGYFTGKYPSSEDINFFHSSMIDNRRTWINAVPTAWWAFLAAMLLLFIVGMVKQCHDVAKFRRSNHIGNYTGLRSNLNLPL
ncbi:hypothetical protein CCR75_003162 [Bremia lactucae]|uniref:Transmembrane protein 198 n=1 Tax=Bremia lactucae TaxID=4779 RepID=A0A976IHN5_BRELC|nr:hypothetical protein CCR75_003164 [Bremia lactucae]TDH72588.1 hypothetical protein CCR75_003162 [Bremia lactucae]